MGNGNEVCVAGATIAEILRLLSSGATGEILLALREGPLRTNELVERVPGYTPRTIYRYAGKLSELEVVERQVERGPPSKVTHTLTDSCGKELLDLVERFADASLTRLGDGRIDPLDWASLNLLADMWEAGLVDVLSRGPRAPGEIARGHSALSYHQGARRVRLFLAAGLVAETEEERRRLTITERCRRAMALVAGLGRWRHHHVIAEDEQGMTAAEMATVLRTAFPLLHAPDPAGILQMDVFETEGTSDEAASVWLEVTPEKVNVCDAAAVSVDSSARGHVKDWIPALLDGDGSQLSFGGREAAARGCVGQLHERLWKRSAPELVSA